MQSLIQLLVVAALSMQLTAAQQTNLLPIEVQFRIVDDFPVPGDPLNITTKLVQRCMRYDSKTLRVGFVNTKSTGMPDNKNCQSTASLFTIVKTESDTAGNLFIGDYSAGTAKPVFVERLPDPKLLFRPYTVNNATADVEVAYVRLDVTTNRLNDLKTRVSSDAATDGTGLLFNSEFGLPLGIMPLTSNVRQFRLKRLDPNTAVTSCATVFDKDGFIGYPSLTNQTAADKRCARNSSIFTFNTKTGQLSIGGRRVRVDEERRLRTIVGKQPWSLFYLRPAISANEVGQGCLVCRVDGGLMVAQPASTLTTSPNGYIIANEAYFERITSEFWPEFI